MKQILYRNIGTLLSLQGASAKQGRYIKEEDLSLIKNAAIVVRDGRFFWMGPDKKIPKQFSKLKVVDMKQATILPGFVECHTHLVFSGNRAAEFEMRNQGVSYSEIAARGGGILSTMKNTRESSLQRLVIESQTKVDGFVRQGVTTLEIKSGYALDEVHELKCLKAMKKLKKIRIVPTYLGAHALPKEYNNSAEYIQFIVDQVLPKIKKQKLAGRVDIFVEKGFFSIADGQKLFTAAKKLGFALAIHADQLSLSGGAQLAMEFKALSADHLIEIDEAAIDRLAKSEVTCVLLPAADLYMRLKYPPARKLIDAGARVALATDFNPGSSPTQDLNLVGLLARLEMKMTLPEVISAYTLAAASALNLQGEIGSIEIGKIADFISINCHWDEMFYSIGQKNIEKVFYSGVNLKLD